MDNNLPLMLLVVALLAGLATLTTRGPAQHARTSDRPWPQLWHALRTHRRVLGLLLLYSLISLPLSITGWPAPGAAVVRTLPLLVGLAGVWWEVRQEACHSEAETIIDHGILAGLTVMALPALAPLSMVIGQAWQAGTLTGMAAVAPAVCRARPGHGHCLRRVRRQHRGLAHALVESGMPLSLSRERS